MLTSIIRTLVPIWWGQLIAWGLGIFPALEPWRGQLLAQGNPLAEVLALAVVPAVGAVITAAWYAFWRWLEPKLPAWLVRAVLGSAKTPMYPKQAIRPDAMHRGDRPSRETPGPDHRA